MSLKDVLLMFATTATGKDSYTAVVFNDINDADSFAKNYDDPEAEKNYEILFTLHSDFKPSLYLKKEMLEKKVEWIQALDKDVFMIVIDKIFN